MSSYQPIAFQKMFTLRAYNSWVCLREEDGFQHLELRQGPFRRQLLLFFNAAPASIATKLKECSDTLARANEIRVYTYPAVEKSMVPALSEFRETSGENRILNKDTFVLDLTQPAETLWENFHKGAKSVCKQAVKDGVRAQTIEKPSDDFIQSFLKLYRTMAKGRGLRVPEESHLEKMAFDGNLIAVKCEGTSGSSILIYCCHPYAIYLHGVNDPSDSKQYGQLLQWEAAQHLKARGFQYYDLGGVPSTDEENGIFRFKKSLGGVLVGPSAEYLFQRKLFVAAKWLKEKIERIRG